MDPDDRREVVECSRSAGCGSLSADAHGWSCPLSDPVGDMMRMLMDPNANPVLEDVRIGMLRDLGVEVVEIRDREI